MKNCIQRRIDTTKALLIDLFYFIGMNVLKMPNYDCLFPYFASDAINLLVVITIMPNYNWLISPGISTNFYAQILSLSVEEYY